MGGRGGRSRTTGGGGGTATESPAAPAPEAQVAESIQEVPRARSRSLPEDVRVMNIGRSREYETQVAGQGIAVRIMDQSWLSTSKANTEIIFGVGVGTGNGSGLSRGALKGRDADRAAVKILKIVQHDVSTRPDGYVYKASAFTGDGYGKERMNAYVKFGFSKPKRAGEAQYAIVKDGKLEPFKPPRGFKPQSFSENLDSLL